METVTGATLNGEPFDVENAGSAVHILNGEVILIEDE